MKDRLFRLILTFSTVWFYFTLCSGQGVEITGCFFYIKEGSSATQFVKCGEQASIQMLNGTSVTCTCNCNTGQGDCPDVSTGSGNSSYNGPTQAELDAYYKDQWDGFLNEQAHAEFEKGKKALESGDCKKALRQFKNASKFADHYVYRQYEAAAQACVDKETSTTQKADMSQLIKPAYSNDPKTDQGTKDDEAAKKKEEMLRKKEEMLRDRGSSSASTSSAAVTHSGVKNEITEITTDIEKWKQINKEIISKYIQQPNRINDAYVDLYTNCFKKKATNDTCNMDYELKKMNYLHTDKTLDDLNPGDVLIFNAKGPAGKIIGGLDNLVSGSSVSDNSHVCTYLGIRDGKKIFLDATPETGTVIIDEDMLREKYSDRSVSVGQLLDGYKASPLTQAEADKLYQSAIEFERQNEFMKKLKKETDILERLKNGENPDDLVDEAIDAGIDLAEWKIFKGNYGIKNGKVLCSQSHFLLIQATGRELPESSIWQSQDDVRTFLDVLYTDMSLLDYAGNKLRKKAIEEDVKFTISDLYLNQQSFLITPISIKLDK